MADIFISYARSDKARVVPLVAALEARGWSIWWDPEIAPGQEFDRQIARELDAAKAVIVVWTPASVDSRWVRGEARLAADRGVLIPVRFDGARLPIDALALHTTDLDDWGQDPQSGAFQQLSRALGPLLRTASAGASSAGSTSLASGPQPARGAPSTGTAAPFPALDAARERQSLSICVLPFTNMSGDPEQEYFSDGISEDIITDLSKVSALAVVARNTAFTFKAKSVDIKQVARQLGVSHVLEGSVRKSGKRVRITAQLIDGATGNHAWAERYDRDLSDIFALQDEISQAIVSALKVTLLPREKQAIEERGTADIEAYDLYLRAQALARSYGPEQILRAIEAYRRSLALDPDFAEAWAGLANVLTASLAHSALDRARARKEMDEAFRRALELAPDAWSTHHSHALLLLARCDWAGAERAFTRAVELAPRSEPSVLKDLGYFLTHVGRAREAVAQLRTALRGAPLSLETSVYLQIALDSVPSPLEAQAEYERSKDLAGDRAIPEFAAMLRMWGHEDAARIKQQFIRYLSHESLTLPIHRDLIEILDRPAAVLASVRRACEAPDYQDPIRQIVLTYWAAHYGDDELALAGIRRSCIDLAGPTHWVLWMPVFARVRKDPRFKDLLRDAGLVDYWRGTGRWPDNARPSGESEFEVW